MFEPLSYQFFLYFILFFVAIFVSFYIPGSFVSTHLGIKNKFTKVVLAWVIGMVMWGLQAYIFGYLGARFLTYAYLIIFFVLFLKNRQLTFPLKKLKAIRQHLPTAILVLIGTLVMLLPVFPSGFILDQSVSFFGGTKDDGLMHLGYIQSMTKSFPPKEPGAHLLTIQNYHYYSDLVIADLVRVWRLPIIHTFFQYFTTFTAALTLLSSIALVRHLKGSYKMVNWFLFFLIFGGGGAYIFMLALHGTFGYHTPAIDNGLMQLLNMPHAVGKMVFLASLIPFFHFLKSKKLFAGIVSAVLFASLFGFKVYFALFASLGILTLALYVLFTQRNDLLGNTKKFFSKNSTLLYSAVIFLLTSAAIYLPVNKAAGGLNYFPLEWPKIFLGEQNFDMQFWWQRKAIYEANGEVFQIAIFDAFAIIVTLIAVYGTRLIGFAPTRNIISFFTTQKYFFLFVPLIPFQLLALYTLQESGAFNVFNFFSVSAVVLSLFAAFYMSRLKPKFLHVAIAIIVISLTVPRVLHEARTTIDNLHEQFYLYQLPPSEHEALNYIRHNTSKDAIIQSHPSNERDRFVAYVSFFSHRYSYLSGNGYLKSHNQDIKGLEKNINDSFKDPSNTSTELKEMGIDILYIQKEEEQDHTSFINSPGLSKVFENNEVIVFEVR